MRPHSIIFWTCFVTVCGLSIAGCSGSVGGFNSNNNKGTNAGAGNSGAYGSGAVGGDDSSSSGMSGSLPQPGNYHFACSQTSRKCTNAGGSICSARSGLYALTVSSPEMALTPSGEYVYTFTYTGGMLLNGHSMQCRSVQETIQFKVAFAPGSPGSSVKVIHGCNGVSPELIKLNFDMALSMVPVNSSRVYLTMSIPRATTSSQQGMCVVEDLWTSDMTAGSTTSSTTGVTLNPGAGSGSTTSYASPAG